MAPVLTRPHPAEQNELTTPHPLVLAFATQGAGGDDEERLRQLLREVDSHFVAFQKKDKRTSFMEILRLSKEKRFTLLVMEGSGFAGGLAALLARLLYGLPFVFSSGDAITPFLSARFPLVTPVFWLYERLLYGAACGFIGWTPYLTGRALTMGAPRAMTAAGWAPHIRSTQERSKGRAAVRAKLGIPANAVVFGLAGSLNWSARFQYCYGMELVQAAVQAEAPIYVLIVGDGSGLPHLREASGSSLGRTILLPGRVSRDEVPDYLAAMDIGSLPQSVDGVGSFRYTTKISEYCAANLPFVTTQIPLAYDLDHGNLWRLPGSSPWDPKFIGALCALMNKVDHAAIAGKRTVDATTLAEFNRERQLGSVTGFLREICESFALPSRNHRGESRRDVERG